MVFYDYEKLVKPIEEELKFMETFVNLLLLERVSGVKIFHIKYKGIK